MLNRKKLIVPYLLPAFALYLIFFLYPTLRGIWISLHQWSGFNVPMKFVGLGNYSHLIKDDLFWSSFRNMMLIFVVGGLFVFGISFLFTSVMSMGIKGKKAIRAIIFFPNIVAPVALAIIWNFMYNFKWGLFNSFLSLFGADPVMWTGPQMAMTSILIVIVWMSVGFYTIILLAGVDKLPHSLFEAARIDGAKPSTIFFRITLPLIWDVLSIAIMLWGISAIKTFEFIWAFFSPEPSTRVYTTAVYQYVQGFGQRSPINELGYSSAIAFTMIIVVAILVLIMQKLLKREVHEL